MGLPEDPAAFLAQAERAANERDAPAAASVYARNAVLESRGNGAQEVHSGAGEIRRAWESYLQAMEERALEVRKTLTTTSGDTIVNDWEATIDGRVESKGVEYWRFDGEGKVYEHRMYGHREPTPVESPLKRLRLALVHPTAALAFMREQRRRKSR